MTGWTKRASKKKKNAENRHCRSPPMGSGDSGHTPTVPLRGTKLIHLPTNRGAMTRVSASQSTAPNAQLVGHSEHARSRDEASVDHPADRDHREPPVHDLDELETRSLPADLEGVEADVDGTGFGWG